MSYKLIMYGVVGHDSTGLGKLIRGQIILRDKISKITTARILACRYSKQNMGTNFGADIYIYEGEKEIEKIYWKSDGCLSEKTTTLLNTPRGYSPIMNYIYDVNARDGTVKLKKNYQIKW